MCVRAHVLYHTQMCSSSCPLPFCCNGPIRERERERERERASVRLRESVCVRVCTWFISHTDAQQLLLVAFFLHAPVINVCERVRAVCVGECVCVVYTR